MPHALALVPVANCLACVCVFRGVVTVDVKLDELDTNQCSADFHVPNAFKNTARCHYETTYVSAQL